MSKALDLARLMTSGSTAIHGEAGVTSSGSTGLTTNLQQGLAKCWAGATISTNTHTLQDSLNVSSLTDDGAGRTDVVFSNNMSNANYSATSMCAISGDDLFAHFGAGSLVLTSEFRCQTTTDANSTTDYDKLCATVHGDLA
tara:strand:- start:131 stop:553 length:423 start_codon:yes stop_codon:yes gene_type:complete